MGKKVLITGATGMVGGEALKLLLADDRVEKVISLSRRESGTKHAKLVEILLSDFTNYSALETELSTIDTVLYCLGAYTGGVSKEKFKEITVDYPVTLAKALVKHNPGARFSLLSGAGADRTEKSRIQFARDKGATENFLSQSELEFYAFRPGYIYPVTRRKEPNLMYSISRGLYPLIKLLGKNASIKSTELAQGMVTAGLNGAEKEVLENRDILGLIT